MTLGIRRGRAVGLAAFNAKTEYRAADILALTRFFH
jgi:hypothetical protein